MRPILLIILGALFCAPSAQARPTAGTRSATKVPSGATRCARENGTCAARGDSVVFYGARDRWYVRKTNRPIQCNNRTFGDPVRGVVKDCYVKARKAPTVRKVPPGFVRCAKERKHCAFKGERTVYYGARDRYVVKRARDGVACNNATFGDPLRGVVKACFIRQDKAIPAGALDPVLVEKLVKWTIKEYGRMQQPVCWKKSYGRTAGKPLTACGGGQEKNGALCYPRCKPGYDGAGPVCWQRCPNGFRNDGAFCAKPKPYGRGAGYPWKFGDKAFSLNGARKRCQRKHGQCEKSGQIIYPKCKPGFHAVGCCMCSPNCVDGQTDIGVSCAKKSYGRGAGSPLQCAPGLEQDGALCYPQCRAGYDGVGPVCWNECSGAHGTNCGAMCGQGSAQCVGEVANMVLAATELVANIAGAALTGGSANVALKSAKTAAKAGSKVAARVALKKAVRQAGRTIGRKLHKRLGSRIIRYVRTRGRSESTKRLAKDYAKEVATRASERLALSAAHGMPELREIAEMIDPTGVVAVVNAFDKPICESAPMP